MSYRYGINYKISDDMKHTYILLLKNIMSVMNIITDTVTEKPHIYIIEIN